MGRCYGLESSHVEHGFGHVPYCAVGPTTCVDGCLLGSTALTSPWSATAGSETAPGACMICGAGESTERPMRNERVKLALVYFYDCEFRDKSFSWLHQGLRSGIIISMKYLM